MQSLHELPTSALRAVAAFLDAHNPPPQLNVGNLSTEAGRIEIAYGQGRRSIVQELMDVAARKVEEAGNGN